MSTAAERPRLTASDILTTSEVAALLRVPRSTVGDLARRGELPSRKIGRRRIFVRQRIEALLLEEPSGRPGDRAA